MEVSEDKDLNNAMNGVEVNELNEEILNKNVNEDNVTEIVRKKFECDDTNLFDVTIVSQIYLNALR